MRQKPFMKRILCLLLAMCCITASMEFGKAEAQAAASLSTMVKQLKAKKYKQATATAKKLPKKANEKCVKKMSAKMKKAYRKKVNSFNRDYSKGKYLWAYYLTDFNNDGKAELLVKYGSCEADVKLMVYQYTNKLKKIGEFYCGHSVFSYYPNGILMSQGHMSYETISQVYMKNGKIKTKVISERFIKSNENYLTLPYLLKDSLSLK